VPVGRLPKKAKPAARHEKSRLAGAVSLFSPTSPTQVAMGLWSVGPYMTTRFTKWKGGGAIKWALLLLSMLWFSTYWIWQGMTEVLEPPHEILAVGALILWGYELRRGLSILRCGATVLCIAILAEITLGWGVRLLLFASPAGGTHYLARHPKLTGSPGTRRALNWLARVGCILIVAVWGLSSRWVFGCGVPVGKDAISVQAGLGNLHFFWLREIPLQLRQKRPDCGCYPASLVPLAPPKWPQVREIAPGMVGCILPCWLVLVGCAIPVYVLWRWDARSSLPGKCGKCGYDLTGNVSGRCPECGAAIDGKSTPVVAIQQTGQQTADGRADDWSPVSSKPPPK
jgi:hypothetical protein